MHYSSCAELQLQTPDKCEFFVWDEGGEECHLRSGFTSASPQGGHFSGPRDASCPCLALNVDYFGNDLGDSDTSSPSACQDLCVADARCKFFTWTAYDNACNLKYSDAGEKNHDHGISGPRICPVGTP